MTRNKKWLAIVGWCTLVTTASWAQSPRDRAYKIYQRVAGIPPSSEMLDQLELMVQQGRPQDVAAEAMKNPVFYNVTLKNMFTPWSNSSKDNRQPLNDMTTTLVGLVRDDSDFREALAGDVVYVRSTNRNAQQAYSLDNNAMHAGIEAANESLADSNLIVRRAQSAVNGGRVPANATSGVLTLQGFADAYYKNGTNRRALVNTLKHFMCYDIEQLHDTTTPGDRIRRDVDREPTGNGQIFRNKCLGCHAGMDPLSGAFSFFDYQVNGNGFRFIYTPTQASGPLGQSTDPEAFYIQGQPVPKANRNRDTHPDGHLVIDDSWVNKWVEGPNASKLQFSSSSPRQGNGVRSLAQMLSQSEGFPQCMVKTVYQQVCLNPIEASQPEQLQELATRFKSSNYNMKSLFADVASTCVK